MKLYRLLAFLLFPACCVHIPARAQQTLGQNEAQPQASVPARPQETQTKATPSGDIQEGVASYYSSRFQGRHTASGEVYDKDKMTAAHRSLPFGTIVKVSRVDNGNFVYVRINDRGPFVSNRLIDLSGLAAARLDILRHGHKKVRLEVMEGNILPGEAEVYSGGQLYRRVRTRLPAILVCGIDLQQRVGKVLPALERKSMNRNRPAEESPVGFFGKMLQKVLPEG